MLLGDYRYSRQEIGKLAHTGIAHEDVQTAEILDRLRDELLPCFRFSNVAWDAHDAGTCVPGFRDQALEL